MSQLADDEYECGEDCAEARISTAPVTALKMIYSGPSAGDSDDEDEDEDEEDDEKLAPTATVLCSLTPGKVMIWDSLVIIITQII